MKPQFDMPRAQKLDRLVKRVGCFVALLVLLFAAVMCVLEALG